VTASKVTKKVVKKVVKEESVKVKEVAAPKKVTKEAVSKLAERLRGKVRVVRQARIVPNKYRSPAKR